ncbi:MAG: hypothetical protein ACM3SS_00960 [Rhodospirillaceae bacterium]
MNRIMTVFAACLVGACASTPDDTNGAAASWLGASYDDVVARWGTPVRSSALADRRSAYTWASESSASRGTIWPSIGVFGGSGGVGVGAGAAVGPGGLALVRCERTLIFRDGHVIDQTWQGDPAYCNTFRR